MLFLNRNGNEKKIFVANKNESKNKCCRSLPFFVFLILYQNFKIIKVDKEEQKDLN